MIQPRILRHFGPLFVSVCLLHLNGRELHSMFVHPDDSSSCCWRVQAYNGFLHTRKGCMSHRILLEFVWSHLHHRFSGPVALLPFFRMVSCGVSPSLEQQEDLFIQVLSAHNNTFLGWLPPPPPLSFLAIRLGDPFLPPPSSSGCPLR